MVLSQFDSIAHLRPPFPKGDHRGIHASQLRSAESSLTPCFVGLFANSAIAVPPVVETTGLYVGGWEELSTCAVS